MFLEKASCQHATKTCFTTPTPSLPSPHHLTCTTPVPPHTSTITSAKIRGHSRSATPARVCVTMTTLSLLALSALSFACPPPCERLQSRVEGSFTCDVRTYSFDLGNKICEGIMPLCVLRPKDAKDVSAAVIVARESGTPLSYRSGGHSYTCNSIKEDSIHLNLRSLNDSIRRCVRSCVWRYSQNLGAS